MKLNLLSSFKKTYKNVIQFSTKAYPDFQNHALTDYFKSLKEKKINIRPIESAELPYLPLTSNKLNLDPGIYEAPFYQKLDPLGCNVITINGNIVGALLGLNHRTPENYGSISSHIIDPSFLKKEFEGVEEKIFHKTMNKLENEVAVIGLCSTPEKIEIYKNLGFQPVENGVNIRWRISSKDISQIQLADTFTNLSKQSDLIIERFDINKTPKKDVKEILAYDAGIYGYNRENVLKKWLLLPEAYTLICKENGKIVGYGVLTRTSTGHKIAPLLADNKKVANYLSSLLCIIAKEINPSGTIIFDSRKNHTSMATIASQLFFKTESETQLMMKATQKSLQGNTPNDFVNKRKEENIYCLHSIELAC